MKTLKLELIVVLLLLGASATKAQKCATPEPLDQKEALGTWKGSYTNDGEFKEITIRFSEQNGNLVASLDIPGAGITNIPYETWICPSQDIHFRSYSASIGSVEFNGRPAKGKMSGRVRFSKGSDIIDEIFVVKRVTENPIASN